MISLTRIDHGVASGWRHGRSRALAAYQRKTGAVYGVVIVVRSFHDQIPGAREPQPPDVFLLFGAVLPTPGPSYPARNLADQVRYE
jgi:hypothetical protein